MNYNRNYFSRKGRSFIPKPIDPGFTIDPAKVEAYKEYCLNNGLIKFPPPVPPTIDGTMEVYDIQQSYTISIKAKNYNTLDNIVYHYTGKNLTDFDYVLCTISGISFSSSSSADPLYLANITSGYVNAVDRYTDSGLSGYFVYQSETGNTVFIIPSFPTSNGTVARVNSPGFEYNLGSGSTGSVVIETLIVGKLPENQ